MVSNWEKQAKYYHAWNHLVEVGPRRMLQLLDRFHCPERAWRASQRELGSTEGISKTLSEKIVQKRSSLDPDELWKALTDAGISLLLRVDELYPDALKEIYDPPPVLYYLGDVELLQTISVAMVGSRRHTRYGAKIARKLAAELVSAGLTVTSGMARGIDTCAHRGALEAEGKTVAVMGCGLDLCYPPENKDLKKRIQQDGLAVSEFPPGVPPAPLHFPRRNRIISGLSRGTVVVEAGLKSGALITAEFALEQGREVFAVPGSIESPYSRGCHKILREGAKLVETVADILEEIAFPVSGCQSRGAGGREHAAQEGFSPEQLSFRSEEMQLLEVVQYEPVSLEELAGFVQIPLPRLNHLLLELEMKGLIEQLPGKNFVRITHGGV